MLWPEFEALLKGVNSYDTGSDWNARTAIRRAFLEMQSAADERDSLRELLIEAGVRNATLEAELAGAKARQAPPFTVPAYEWAGPRVTPAHTYTVTCATSNATCHADIGGGCTCLEAE